MPTRSLDPMSLLLLVCGLLLTSAGLAGGFLPDPELEVARVAFETCLEVCAGDLWAWTPEQCECGCH